MYRALKEALSETSQAILPVSLLIIILQLVLSGIPLISTLQFVIGMVMVIAGLFLFLTGVKVALLPMGEMVGAQLPKLGSLILVLIFAFVLGFAVTVAEPHVQVLGYQVEMVSGDQISPAFLFLMVAIGVGLLIALAMLRLVLGFSYKVLLAISYLLILILSFLAPPAYVPIAFDAGGIITGPLLAPFILALGIGTVSVLGGRSSLANSFGLLGLAAAGPVIALMLMGVFMG
jgi:hypothetical protein